MQQYVERKLESRRTSSSEKAEIMVKVEAVVQRPAPRALAVLVVPPAASTCFPAAAAMPSILFVCAIRLPARADLAAASAAALAAVAARPTSEATTPTIPVTLPARKIPALSKLAIMASEFIPVDAGAEKSLAIESCSFRETQSVKVPRNQGEDLSKTGRRTSERMLSMVSSWRNS